MDHATSSSDAAPQHSTSPQVVPGPQPAQAANADQARQIVGVDWGSTGRHAYLLDARGQVLQQHHDVTGVGNLRSDARETLGALLTLLQADPNIPTDFILSGLAGSAQGWQEIPLLDCQHPLKTLPQAQIDIDCALPHARCRIVPGYEYTDEHGKPDMLQGEEMYLLGALLQGAADDWFILPGTHSKWVLLERGCIVDVLSFMTGEFFALMTQHGALADLMQQREPVPQAFDAGILAAGRGGLTRMALECQVLVETGAMPAAHVYSYVSGLLVGCEFHEIRQRTNARVGGTVHLVGDAQVLAPYQRATELFSLPTQQWSREQVYLAALRQMAEVANDKAHASQAGH